MAELIEVRDLVKVFPARSQDGSEIVAANNVNFKIAKGDIFGIIGLSGAGKSTLVRCLNLLERPTSGEVIIDGKNLTTCSEKELRMARRKIGMIFQGFNLLMQRNVLDNVCFPMEIAGMKKSEARKKAKEYLETVGLAEKADAYPVQLSGGQKQRVAIARVLAAEPDIILSDEATSALDPQTTKSILGLLKDINKKYGITIVLITHEMSVVQEICNHVIVLEKGAIVEGGEVNEIFRNPKTEATKKLLVNEGREILHMEGGQTVRLTFAGSSAFEPVIGNVILQYKTPLNILFADVKRINNTSHGQMIVQLPKDEKLAFDMITYIKEHGIGVERWEENGTEGTC